MRRGGWAAVQLEIVQQDGLFCFWSCLGCGAISREANRARNKILINRNARSPERRLSDPGG